MKTNKLMSDLLAATADFGVQGVDIGNAEGDRLRIELKVATDTDLRVLAPRLTEAVDAVVARHDVGAFTLGITRIES